MIYLRRVVDLGSAEPGHSDPHSAVLQRSQRIFPIPTLAATHRHEHRSFQNDAGVDASTPEATAFSEGRRHRGQLWHSGSKPNPVNPFRPNAWK